MRLNFSLDLFPPEDQFSVNAFEYKASFLACFPSDSDSNRYVRAWIQRFLQDRAPDRDFSRNSASQTWLKGRFVWNGWELNNLPLKQIRKTVENASLSNMCFFNEDLLEEMVEFIMLGRGMRIHEAFEMKLHGQSSNNEADRSYESDQDDSDGSGGSDGSDSSDGSDGSDGSDSLDDSEMSDDLDDVDDEDDFLV